MLHVGAILLERQFEEGKKARAIQTERHWAPTAANGLARFEAPNERENCEIVLMQNELHRRFVRRLRLALQTQKQLMYRAC